MKEITATIEIPKGSNIKYEYDRKEDSIVVDRVLREGFKYPGNYGFIPGTLDWDGDELDILVYSKETFMPGVKVNARILGAMKMIDTGETDTKIIAVHSDDYRNEDIKELEDLPQKWLKEIETFFTTYKNWKYKGITKVEGFEGKLWAVKEYKECIHLMKNYGSMSKSDFIEKMQKDHPEKYKKDGSVKMKDDGSLF